MVKKCYIGIDPGSTGAIAISFSYKDEVIILDIKGEESTNKQVVMGPEVIPVLRGIRASGDIVYTVLEYVHAFPLWGCKGNFGFGRNYGICLSLLAVLGIPYELVSPRTWQNAVLDPAAKAAIKATSEKQRYNKRKAMNFACAQRMFPQVSHLLKTSKKDRADALLIMKYCQYSNWAKEGIDKDVNDMDIFK